MQSLSLMLELVACLATILPILAAWLPSYGATVVTLPDEACGPVYAPAGDWALIDAVLANAQRWVAATAAERFELTVDLSLLTPDWPVCRTVRPVSLARLVSDATIAMADSMDRAEAEWAASWRRDLLIRQRFTLALA